MTLDEYVQNQGGVNGGAPQGDNGSYLRNLYTAYAGHPQMQNAVVQKYFESQNPANSTNALTSLLNSNLGGQPEVISAADNPFVSQTQPNQQPQSTPETPQGTFGFGGSEGQLFGHGGLLSQIAQPVTKGIIDPAISAVQSGIKTGSDILNGAPISTTGVNPIMFAKSQGNSPLAFLQALDPRNNESIQNSLAAAQTGLQDQLTKGQITKEDYGQKLQQLHLLTAGAGEQSAIGNSANAVENQSGAQGLPGFLSTNAEDRADYFKNPLISGGKSALSLASMAIPVGEGANLTTRLALGTAQGAGIGLGNSKSGQEGQGILTGATGGFLGTGAGELIGTAAGKLFGGKTGEATAQVGKFNENAPITSTLDDLATVVKSAKATAENPGTLQKTGLTNYFKDIGGEAPIKGVDPIGKFHNEANIIKNATEYYGEKFTPEGIFNTERAVNQAKTMAIEQYQKPFVIDTQKIVPENIVDDIMRVGEKPPVGKGGFITNKDTQSYISDRIKKFLPEQTDISKLQDPIVKLAGGDLESIKQQATEGYLKTLPTATKEGSKDFVDMVDAAIYKQARDKLETIPGYKAANEIQSAIIHQQPGLVDSFNAGNSNVSGYSPKSMLTRSLVKPIKQGVDKSLMGMGDLLANKGGAGLPKLPTGLLGSLGSTSISNPAGQTQQNDNAKELEGLGLPTSLSENATPQGSDQAKALASQLLQQGYTDSQIKSAFQLKGLPNPFTSVSPAQQQKIQATASAYNSVNDLIDKIRNNSNQFGSIGGGVVGDVISGSNTGGREAIKKDIKDVALLAKRITGRPNVTNEINMMQDPDTLISNLRQIQSDIYDRYNTIIGSNANGSTITINQ